MDEYICPYAVVRKTENKTIHINCRSCTHGESTISDETCRSNIFTILRQEQGVDQLIFNHALVKIFNNEHLELLNHCAQFIEKIEAYGDLKTPPQDTQSCRRCAQTRHAAIQNMITLSKKDPLRAFHQMHTLINQENPGETFCPSCIEEYTNRIKDVMTKSELAHRISQESFDSESFYSTVIRPYVRPGFIDSYIQMEPPNDAVFLESYDVSRKDGRPMKVSLYILRTRPEKLYFVVPSEYDLPRKEIELLEQVRLRLSQHRPKDASFMDAETAREYFHRFGRNIIAILVKENQLHLSVGRIEYLSDLFARYTAGFGILEDLLLDSRIQDIYVNAPVNNNPLHIVLDGEEYTSNIFLSQGDIDALSSRFRTLSGRAFSEASPILDMDLGRYHTRVAAIASPLTPKGIAFAFRRHREKPWTLTHFIANHMLSAEAAGLLSFLVDGQASLLIAGSRGSGKTSLLGALMLEIPQRFRILTIEDTAEIPVDQLQKFGYKIQSLITKSISSGAASTEVDPAVALRTALRLGESVLVLGEVRGVEAKVLFEAMRIGAAGNLIMGTIHGSTTRDVFERVVYDIGVPATSFKAVDAVVIAAPIRAEGGMERKRRLLQVSEITKTGWTTTPDPEKIFQDLMMYDAVKDELCTTDLLDMGQSQLIRMIARKWGITVEKALQNIKLRTMVKSMIVDKSKENPDLLEALMNRDANNALWMFIEECKIRKKTVDYRLVQKQWTVWFQSYVERRS